LIILSFQFVIFPKKNKKTTLIIDVRKNITSKAYLFFIPVFVHSFHLKKEKEKEQRNKQSKTITSTQTLT